MAIAIAAPRVAPASPVQLFGFGGRSPGLAGVGVADPMGWESLYLNPAGLGRVRTKHVYAGLSFGRFELRGIDRPIEDAFGRQLGLAAPIPFGGALKDRVAFAAGGVFPSGLTQRVRAPRPGTPYFALLESRAQTMVAQVGTGIRVTDKLFFGAGILALGALRGRIDLDTDTVGRISARSEVGLKNDIAPIAGALYRHRWDLGFGLVIRGASDSAYDVDVYSELDDELALVLPDIQLAGVSQYDPLTVAFEVAWRWRTRTQISAQLAWERWSAFPLPARNPVIGQPERQPPGFHDTVVPRLSIEHLWWTFSLRAGYTLALSPAPEMTTEHALADNHRHVFALGFGKAGSGRVSGAIDLWFQLHILQPRRHQMPSARTSGMIAVGGFSIDLELQ